MPTLPGPAILRRGCTTVARVQAPSADAWLSSQPRSTLGTTSSEGAKLLKLAAMRRDGSAVLAAAFPAMPANADSSAARRTATVRAEVADGTGTRDNAADGAGRAPRGLWPSQPARSCCLPEAAAARSEQLEKTARQADQQVRHGFELANRGAYYAARAEFVAGLRLLAQALDAERHTTNHSRSLGAALTALKEAGDFLPAGGKLEADLDLPAIIASHRTPVLKNTAVENLVPLLALKSYFTFAQAQFSAAAGHEVAGSMALYALGKLHAAAARQRNLDLPAAEPKAVVFYQASLLVCPQNYMSANDLGVVLAQGGYYAERGRRWSTASSSRGNRPTWATWRSFISNWGNRGWPSRRDGRPSRSAGSRSSGCGRGRLPPTARCSGSIRGRLPR